MRWGRILVLCTVCLVTACAADDSGRLRLVAQTGFAAGFAVAISPDGRFALTGEAAVARLWHLETGRELRRFHGSGQVVLAVAFSMDGKTAFTAGDGSTIRAWDVESGAEKWHRETGGSRLNAAAISDDSRFVIVAPEGAPLQIWDLSNAKLAVRLAQPFPNVNAVAISKSLNVAVAMGSSVAVTAAKRTYAHPAKVVAVAISPDGKLLATAAEDKIARLWNLETGEVLHELRGSRFGPFGVAFSPDGRWLFTASDQDRVWDVQTGQLIRAHDDITGLGHFAFTPDGRTVVSGGVRTTIRDLDTGQLHGVIEGKTLVVKDGGFLQDGRILLVDSFDQQASVILSAQNGLTPDGPVGGSYCFFITVYPALGVTLGCRNEFGPKPKGSAQLMRTQDKSLIAEFGPYDATIAAARLTLDGATLIVLAFDGTLAAWDVKTRVEKFRVPTVPAALATLDVSRDGLHALVAGLNGKHVLVDLNSRATEVITDQRIVMFAPDGSLLKAAFNGTVTIQDIGGAQEIRRFEIGLPGVDRVVLSPDGRRLFAGTRTGIAALIDYASGKVESTLQGHWSSITRAVFSPDGRRLLTLSFDGQVRLWDVELGKSMATLVFLSDGNWAVLDEEGRYDASNPKGLSGVHWVLKNEPIELGQLKNRFWVPGLLSRILKGERLPEVPEAFHHLDLYPVVKVDPPANGARTLKVQLANQGGGLGRVVVKVNGREIPLDGRGRPDPSAPAASLSIELSQTVLSPDGNNQIEVAAYDAQGLVVSRGVAVAWKTETRQTTRQHLYALVAGTSHYSGAPAMNLRYPAKDASDIARAIGLGGNELFGPDHTHITLLNSDGDAAHLPTKANFRRAFAEIASAASAGDTVLLYLAGHGIAKGKDTYFYLTADARSLELDDPALVDVSTVSSVELQKWLQSDVKALKRLVILDTCAAGAANADFIKLGEKRELSADQMRAIELLNDSAGSHILMGSAADKVSYEASRYGQGLLTYALLAGMKGELQLEGNQLDVLRWFTYAQRKVEALAKGIGGIQQPLLSSPMGKTFPVALLPNEVKRQIPLSAPKPQVLRAMCLSSTMSDPLGIGPLVRERLRDLSDPVARGQEKRRDAPLVYLDAVPDGLPGAISPRATYRRSQNGGVDVTLVLIRDGDEKELATRTLSGDEHDTRALAGRIADNILEALTKVEVPPPEK